MLLKSELKIRLNCLFLYYFSLLVTPLFEYIFRSFFNSFVKNNTSDTHHDGVNLLLKVYIYYETGKKVYQMRKTKNEILTNLVKNCLCLKKICFHSDHVRKWFETHFRSRLGKTVTSLNIL